MLVRFLKTSDLVSANGARKTYLPGAQVDVGWVIPSLQHLSLVKSVRGVLPDGEESGFFHVWHYPANSLRRHETPFYPQTDNLREPHRTCNTSCNAMLLECLRPHSLERRAHKGEQPDDTYYRTLIKYGDTTDHMAHTHALKDYGLVTSFKYDWGFTELNHQLAKGIPTVIGILHRGTSTQPTGGHMVLVLRRDHNTGGYFCHDPYGSLHDSYMGNVQKGNGVLYTRQQMVDRWLNSKDVDDKTGWARQVISW